MTIQNLILKVKVGCAETSFIRKTKPSPAATRSHLNPNRCSAFQAPLELCSSSSSLTDVANNIAGPTNNTARPSISGNVSDGRYSGCVSGEMCVCGRTADEADSRATERDGVEVNGVAGEPSKEP
jgi:hypothetical protein